MSEKFAPKISKKELEIEDSWDFLETIVGVYVDWIGKKWPEFVLENFSDEQNALYVYYRFQRFFPYGGFVQIIHLSYEEKVFDENFIQKMHEFWLERTAKILEKAKKNFEKYAEKFVNVDRKDWNVFTDLYKEYPEFQDFDNKFYEINGEEVDILAEYVRENISDFIEVTE